MARKAKKPNGAVIYRGPSRIDGAPIVCIVTGTVRPSKNPKTGPMLQTWILRADMNPAEALSTGADSSICGGCQRRPRKLPNGKRGKRSCYVNMRAPQKIFKTFLEGAYPVAALADLPALFAGKVVRLGAYGDPAALPIEVWDAALSLAARWTGYTHQWRNEALRDILKYCQISADSMDEAETARAAGVGSFRVLNAGETALPFEMHCPASAEAGMQTTCFDCTACSGFNGASVVIAAHGSGKKWEPSPRRRISLTVLNPARAARA